MKRRNGFIHYDRTVVSGKIKESFSSVMPVTLIVLLLCITVAPIDAGIFLSFVLGAFFVVLGMGLFTLGADTSMTPIGNYVGTEIIKTKKLWLIIPVYFLVGVLITIAEPDLQVLANQLGKSIDKPVLLISVGVGVGVFLVIAFLRIALKISLKYLLIVSYGIVFVLAFILHAKGLDGFIPLSFDSGGVTTGPMSVPFIIAIGTGIASLRSDGNAENDGFGLTALCSVGPIISVMIIGLIFKPEIIPADSTVFVIDNSRQLFGELFKSIPEYLKEVGISLLPIVSVFLITYAFGSKFERQKFIKILVGLVYTYIGLVLFLSGVNFGFFPVGKILGQKIGELSYNVIIVPVGMVIGFFVVAAEPAVHVLTEQVYEITSGALPKKALSVSLMIGVAFSVGISMLRILLKIDILYFLVPAYIIALVLTFIVPDIFSAVAFDSGGVASGAMTSSFLLPLAIGLCDATGGNYATEGFGVVAMVAMTPLITIQILGLVFKLKKRKLLKGSSKPVSKKRKKKEDIID